MIRKTILVVLTLAALLSAAAWVDHIITVRAAIKAGTVVFSSELPGLTNVFVVGGWLPDVNLEFGSVSIPFWMFVAAFLTYPTIAFIRGPWRRYRRRKKGLCIKCGYDLTGNESGTCPECGDVIKKTAHND